MIRARLSDGSFILGVDWYNAMTTPHPGLPPFTDALRHRATTTVSCYRCHGYGIVRGIVCARCNGQGRVTIYAPISRP